MWEFLLERFPSNVFFGIFLENHLLHVILSLLCVVEWLFGATNKLSISNMDNPYFRPFHLVSFSICFSLGRWSWITLKYTTNKQIQILLVLGQLVLSYVVEMFDHLHFGFCFYLPYFLPRKHFIWLPLSSVPLVDQFDLFGHFCCFNWFRSSDDPICGAFCIQKQILDNALFMGELSYVS